LDRFEVAFTASEVELRRLEVIFNGIEVGLNPVEVTSRRVMAPSDSGSGVGLRYICLADDRMCARRALLARMAHPTKTAVSAVMKH